MGHLGGQDLDGPASPIYNQNSKPIDFGGLVKPHYEE